MEKAERLGVTAEPPQKTQQPMGGVDSNFGDGSRMIVL